MQRLKRAIVTFALTAVMMAALLVPSGPVAAANSNDGFNDEYIYATTREVNKMDAPAALKLTLFPATIIVDTAFLPFAVIAGFVA